MPWNGLPSGIKDLTDVQLPNRVRKLRGFLGSGAVDVALRRYRESIKMSRPRPYYQDGYVAGTFPHRRDSGFNGKLDFGHRLVAKFKLPKTRFWSGNFRAFPDDALYPDADDVRGICDDIKAILHT